MSLARRFAVIVVIAALGSVFTTACSQGADAKGGKAQGASSANGPATGKFTGAEYVIGNPAAKVTVVEYLSNTCSHCAAFDAQTWPAIKAKYVDTGKVKWIIREFLTPPEPVSAAGFVLARCAGRDKYFSVVESIFHSQEEMFKTGDFKGPFLKIAQSMGMNEQQFNACLQDDAAYNALYDRVKKAVEVDKIDGTPTIFINGKKAFEAEASVAQVDAALAPLVAAAGQ
jgi:protein-disulfide isomerase